MRTFLIVAVALMIISGALALQVTAAQVVGSKRTDLQRHDLSAPGREVVQTIVELAPGTTAPRHTLPGRRDHLCPRRHLGIHGGGQTADDPRVWRRPIHPG